jgi:S-methylmethionine-dependent homocysteine/selenocysteine methylase
MTAPAAVTILDGGMGRQLQRMGAPFRVPEWSALALMEAPDYVTRAHQAFVDAGAEILTTNSYGLVPHMLRPEVFARDAARLARLAGELARQVATAANQEAREPRIRIAGSLPPLFESYQPWRFDARRAPAIAEVLVTAMAPSVDLWLIETQSSVVEAATTMRVARQSERPVWVSFTLRDERGWRGPAQVRSGEPVEEAAARMLDAGAEAVLFNCCQAEVMDAAVQAAVRAARLHGAPAQIGVYANAFVPEERSDAPYGGISELRGDLTPPHYLQWARQWVASGASIIGGCCGIGPEHIALLRAQLA